MLIRCKALFKNTGHGKIPQTLAIAKIMLENQRKSKEILSSLIFSKNNLICCWKKQQKVIFESRLNGLTMFFFISIQCYQGDSLPCKIFEGTPFSQKLVEWPHVTLFSTRMFKTAKCVIKAPCHPVLLILLSLLC